MGGVKHTYTGGYLTARTDRAFQLLPPKTSDRVRVDDNMNGFYVFAAALTVFCACAAVQQQQRPVPILKQVNRQNEDGSYSYGYENADGTYKIETKYPTGEVYGKYGYVDETGRQRTVEYGASSSGGFRPTGEGIDVPPPPPPPTGNGERDGDEDGGNAGADGRDTEADYDDGQYREDPGAYYRMSERQGAGHKRQRAYYRPAAP